MAFDLEQIDSVIMQALEALLERYYRDGNKWLCPGNHPKPDIESSGNVVASEALLCFLLPLVASGPQSSLQDKIFRCISRDELKSMVQNHLKSFTKDLDFTGSPYIEIIDKRDNYHAFLDSHCFLISILIFYAEIFGDEISDSEKSALGKNFARSIKFMTECAVKNRNKQYTGFFVTNSHLPDVPYKYPTWMAVDTLSDVEDLIESKSFLLDAKGCSERCLLLVNDVLPQIKAEYIRKYVRADLAEIEEQYLNGRNMSLTEGLIEEDEGDIEPHYNVWAILILLFLGYKSDKDFTVAFLSLSKYITDKKTSRTTLDTACKIPFDSEEHFPASGRDVNVLIDRCFLPQFVKALAIFIRKNGQIENKPLSDLLNSSYELLLTNRGDGLKVWDKYAEGPEQFAIYQTERAIEALCHLRRLAAQTTSISTPELTPRSNTVINDEATLDSILKAAIQIKIGAEDGRELIEREISTFLEVNKLVGLTDRIDKLEQHVEELTKLIAETLKSMEPDSSRSGRKQEINDITRDVLGKRDKK